MSFTKNNSMKALEYGLIDYVEIIRTFINQQNEQYAFGPVVNKPAHLVESVFNVGDFMIVLGTNVSSVHNVYVEISINKTIANKQKIYDLYESTGMVNEVKDGHRYYVRLREFSDLMSNRVGIKNAVEQAFTLLKEYGSHQ